MPASQCAPIADLAARARHVDLLCQQIVARLPAPLRDNVAFAGVRNDRVLLLVHSAAWATRVRMDQSRILAAVRSLGLAASSVTVKVAPTEPPTADSIVASAPSPETARAIRAAAAAVADPDLRALFFDLADAAERPLGG